MIDVRAYGDVALDVRAAGGDAERDEAREQRARPGGGAATAARFGSTERSSATLE